MSLPLGGSLSGRLVCHLHGVSSEYAKVYPDPLVRFITGFNLAQAVVILMVSETSLQPGSPILIESIFETLLFFSPPLVLGPWPFRIKIMEDTVLAAKPPVLISGIDSVCRSLPTLSKQGLVLEGADLEAVAFVESRKAQMLYEA